MKPRDLCRLLLGGALLAGSLIKVILPEQFVRVVASHGTVPRPLLLPVSMGLPFVEMILGSLLIFGFCRRAALGVTTVLSLAALLALSRAASQGLAVDCLMPRAFGFAPPTYSLHMLRHAILAGGALALLLREVWLRANQSSPTQAQP